MMNDLELDRVYTSLCRALSAAGEGSAMQGLSRFALLAMLEIDDAEKIENLIHRAVTKA